MDFLKFKLMMLAQNVSMEEWESMKVKLSTKDDKAFCLLKEEQEAAFDVVAVHCNATGKLKGYVCTVKEFSDA